MNIMDIVGETLLGRKKRKKEKKEEEARRVEAEIAAQEQKERGQYDQRKDRKRPRYTL